MGPEIMNLRLAELEKRFDHPIDRVGKPDHQAFGVKAVIRLRQGIGDRLLTSMMPKQGAARFPGQAPLAAFPANDREARPSIKALNRARIVVLGTI